MCTHSRLGMIRQREGLIKKEIKTSRKKENLHLISRKAAVR